MCAVAGRGLFRGWGPDELAQVGIGLSLFQLPALAALSMEVIAQEAAESHSGSTRERRPAPAVVTESLGAIGTAVMSAAGVPEGIAHQEGRSDRAGARQAESVGEQPEGSRLILPGGAPALA
jgi:hypothetical protein